jgi:environmental stress-induced protein Ves
MQIRRYQDYRCMAWKNGGGETAEIAVFPEGATLDTFEWRVSMANVATDGPFSVFPGVDRTLAILQGDGLTLLPASRGPMQVEPTSPPVTFPSELSVMAHLRGSTIIDFNVMTRRGRFRHCLSRMSLSEPTTLVRHGALMMVFLQSGEADISYGTVSSRLERHDTALLDGVGETECRITPLKPVTVCVVDMWPD